MLDQLLKYGRDNSLKAEPGFAPKMIKWGLRFDETGAYTGAVELGEVDNKRNRGREFPKCPDYSFSDMKAQGVIKSHFLADSSLAVTLYAIKDDDEKSPKKRAYHIDLLRQAAIVCPELGPVAEALAQEETVERIRADLAEAKAKPTELVTLMIDDRFPIKSKIWHDWWREHRTKWAPPPKIGKKSQSDPKMLDLATGKLVEPAKTHPKIKGLSDVGGMSTGDVLIGFKQPSFCSYGLAQSTNAAVSVQAAADYSSALNHIIKEHSSRLANVKVAHWFKESVTEVEDPMAWMNDPMLGDEELTAQQRARRLLKALDAGHRPDLAENYYYAVTLSGASGRVMVRDWMEGQFEDLVRNVNKWFDDLAIVARHGQGLAPAPKFMAVMGGSVRDLGDLTGPMISQMRRTAITGSPIPETMLAQVNNRVRIDVIQDEVPRHARLGLIKAYHLRQGDENIMPYLNEQHPSPAYHCGRLMAVLAAVQRAALGDVGAGVVQRYYAAASATPAMVLGRLTQLSQHHLTKIGGGLAYYFEQKIAAIWGEINDSVPETLALAEQSLFALGYYQEMAELRKPRQKEDQISIEESTDE